MYSINKQKKCGEFDDDVLIDGFSISSKKKSFNIKGTDVKNINISSKKLASPLVSNKVMKKYNKLLEYLTELLVSDDDTGDAMREALNHIEKFRVEIKIKHRKYLMKKDLEMMSKQLVKLQKAANNRLLEIHNSYLEQLNRNRSK